MIPEKIRRQERHSSLGSAGHSLEGSMNLLGPQATYFEKLLT